jgi:hypothetical protein
VTAAGSATQVLELRGEVLRLRQQAEELRQDAGRLRSRLDLLEELMIRIRCEHSDGLHADEMVKACPTCTILADGGY